MSSFNLTKKFQPAKKAWKSFTTSLQAKFHKFRICKTLKTTQKHSFTALHNARSSVWRKLQALRRRSGTQRRGNHSGQNLHYHHLRTSNAATICIDELFPKPRHDVASSSIGGKTEVTMNVGKKQQDERVATSGVKILDGKNGQSNGSIVADKWKLPMLPQFRGIDERAEEFIAKFRKEMKLEREQSILDFEETLARST